MNPCIWPSLVALLTLTAHPASLTRSTLPVPLPDHPGNVFLERESVEVRLPTDGLGRSLPWRLVDDRGHVVDAGTTGNDTEPGASLSLGTLGIGWYRMEFGPAGQPPISVTTAAVLGRLQAPTPLDSPVCVDSATAWFARDDIQHQRRLANLATLAGVNWVRDRMRWSELQPRPGPLVAEETTYDTAASVQHQAGLQILQVFHDSPSWSHTTPNNRGHFAPDLRHVHDFAGRLAQRFAGVVQAWEPWNEANVATFGAHTVDQQCCWQKAAWLGFKAHDPDLIVGWNASAAVPTGQQTQGILANETWPYYDTYNIHTYDWAHAYTGLWGPAREATAGRPLWITEADRGTAHLNQPPFFDQEPHLERLKAEYIAQAYANSLFAGAQRHFHFILGHYHEPNGVQFGLLRLDLTPRPAYVALAAVGRYLAGASILGRWEPAPHVNVVAFHARPDGRERDVLVVWVEQETDWDGRGKTTVPWPLPRTLPIVDAVDYLGRSLGNTPPDRLTSAPIYVLLPSSQATSLPLTAPPQPAPHREGEPSSIVLQLNLPRSTITRVEDRPWSEGYAYHIHPDEPLTLRGHAYNFAAHAVQGPLSPERVPEGWQLELETTHLDLPPGERQPFTGRLRIPSSASVHDGWVILKAECAAAGRPVLAFRVRARTSD